MKQKTWSIKNLHMLFCILVLCVFTLFANAQNITRISPQEAGNMRKGNPNKELAVTYTVAELREILDQSSDGLIQFQFAKDKGRFTLVIALNIGENESENGASASRGPNSKMNDLTRKSLYAAAFYSGGRLCPPPSNCLIE